jgi:septation ring formation regulator EzrA
VLSLARAGIDRRELGCDNWGVTEAEFMERIDAHLEEARDQTVSIQEEIRLSRDERAETREFMRELTLRHERSTNKAVATLRAQTSAMNEISNAMNKMAAHLQDLHDESVAQRESIWQVHDRLDELRPGEDDERPSG